MNSEEIERLAHKRARAKLGWYAHALLYVLVNLFILALAYSGVRSRPWNIYPALGWGVGLALHGISVFVLSSGSSLSETMVRRERERLQREQERRP